MAVEDHRDLWERLWLPDPRESFHWFLRMLWRRVLFGPVLDLAHPTFRDGDNGELLMWQLHSLAWVRCRHVIHRFPDYWTGPTEL